MKIENEIERERLYERLQLSRGSHSNGTEACLMNMVAILNGERITDAPICACPVIARFAIQINDRLPSKQRQMLKPYAPALIGTRDGHDTERMRYLANRACKVFAPFWLRRAGRDDLALTLEACADFDWPALCAAAAAAAFYAYAAADAYAAIAAHAADQADADDLADAAAYAAYAYAYTAAAPARLAPALTAAAMPMILQTFDDLILIGAETRKRPALAERLLERVV